MSRSLLATVLGAAVLLAGCSQRAPSPRKNDVLTVSIAASTADVMAALVAEFKTRSPRVEIKLNAGPSSGLANQIIAGAPADLFLSANEQWAGEVDKAGHSAASVALLTNSLVLVAPKDNPAGVAEPEDLLSDKVKKVALAGEQVPAGIYADQALKALGLADKLTAGGKIVRGQDVQSALSYVERGEADAGIVYSTDVASAPGVKVVHEFDPKLHDKIVYMLVLVKPESGAPPAAAREFYEFLQSEAAEKTFQEFGFERLRKENR